MSNNAGFGTSVKDYAAQRGKTIQAVYQQMKRKENAAALEGHVFLHKVGNKNVKYLDDEAVDILDRASHSAPITIVENGLKEDLALLQSTNKQLEAHALKLQGQVDLLKEMLESKNQELRMLDEPKRRIEAQEAQISVLRADNDVLGQKIAQAEKTAQEASDELTRIQEILAHGSFRERRQLRRELKKKSKE